MSSWGTQSGTGREVEYDRKNYYVHSTNKHNHSTSIRPQARDDARAQGMPESTTLPVEFVSQIHALVADPRTAYRTVQDFIRDAVYHRLHDLDDIGIDNFYNRYFAIEMVRQELAAILKEDEALENQIQFFTEAIEKFAADDNPHGIADVIEVMRRQTPPLRLLQTWRRAIRGWEDEQRRVEERTAEKK